MRIADRITIQDIERRYGSKYAAEALIRLERNTK